MVKIIKQNSFQTDNMLKTYNKMWYMYMGLSWTMFAFAVWFLVLQLYKVKCNGKCHNRK